MDGSTACCNPATATCCQHGAADPGKLWHLPFINETNFRQNRTSGLAAGIALPRRWCILISSFLLLPAIIPAEGRGIKFVLLYVFLFGQRFLSNPRADSHQSSHVGVAWVGTCLLPFWGLAASGGRKKGQMKFSLLWQSMGIFAFLRFLSDISATRARIHTKYYLCTDNFCRRAPSPCGIHRPSGGGGRES